MMKRKQKRPASSDEGSDVEPNIALIAEKQMMEADERQERTEGEGLEEESEAPGEGEESTEEEAESEEEVEGSRKLRTREDVQKELSHMSFEDVLKLQDKVGTKVYHHVRDGGSGAASGKRRRLNKNRPVEVSVKRRVEFLRQVVSVNKSTLRDPRFDDLSGEYKSDIFEKTYGFINDIKRREKEVVEKKLKKAKSDKKKAELQFLVKRMENQERARASREQQRNTELQVKRQQRQRANQGQAPLFINNSQRKKLQLMEKYQDLKSSGRLHHFLSKKRKRNATKDRKRLPPQPHAAFH